MNVMQNRDAFLLGTPSQEKGPFQWAPEVAGFLRRRWRLMGTCTLAALVAGGAYVVACPPSYTSTTSILIDSRNAQTLQGQVQASDGQAQNAAVETQAEVLHSDGIAHTVVDQLKLLDDPAFVAPTNPIRELMAAARALVPVSKSGEDHSDAARTTEAIQRLQSMTTVRRIGLTYVISVDVTATTPQEAARLAHGITDAYIADELGARADMTKQATVWMQERIGQLRTQALDADRAVQAYKAQTGIIDTGNGGLLNEQQLAELNSQLVAAQGRVAEAKARLDSIHTVMNSSGAGNVTDALNSAVITQLRQRYLDDARQEAAVSAQYGHGHIAAVKLRNEMAELQGSMHGEMSRIAQSYQSALDMAQANAKSIQAQLSGLSGEAGHTNNDLAMLRSLQSQADTYRNLYGSFLQRYSQAAQDQSFPVAEARVISAAAVPLHKSAPRTGVVLAGSAVLGLMLGTLLAFTKEALETGLRTASDVRDGAGLPFLGTLPRMRLGFLRRRAYRRLLKNVVTYPGTSFAHGINRIRLRVLNRRRARGSSIIGCIAPRPGEGTTVVAGNLAHALAMNGRRTVLVDMGGGPTSLTTLVPSSLDQTDTASSLMVVRMTAEGGIDAMAAALRKLGEDYECVVVDLPAIDPPAPVHEILDTIDSFVVVARWGDTNRTRLAEALTRADLDESKLLGVVLTGSAHDDGRTDAPNWA